MTARYHPIEHMAKTRRPLFTLGFPASTSLPRIDLVEGDFYQTSFKSILGFPPSLLSKTGNKRLRVSLDEYPAY